MLLAAGIGLAAVAPAHTLPAAGLQSTATAQVRDGDPAPSPSGTAVIDGTVLTPSGRPAPGARVMLSGPGTAGSRVVTTDDLGRFAFTGLAAGRYLLNASKPGYLAVSYGQRRIRAPGGGIRVADGERRSLSIQLPRGGVITGMVLDEHGEPLPNVHVRALRAALNGARFPQFGGASTDDRGIYRIHSLEPGEYAVCASHRDGPSDRQRLQMEIDALREATERGNAPSPELLRKQLAGRMAELKAQLAQSDPPSGYSPVCHPGTSTAASGTLIPVAAGEERVGVDLQMFRVPVARIEGMVVMPPEAAGQGDGPPDVQVTLVNADETSAAFDTQGARVSRDGRFTFFDIPAGQYRVIARTMGRIMALRMLGPQARTRAAQGPPALWAAADVSVAGENVSGVVLQLQRGVSISGQLVFEGSRQPPSDLSRLRIMAQPHGRFGRPGPELAMPAQGEVDGSGRFRIDDVMPGQYRLILPIERPNGWILESVAVGGRDTLDLPIEITGGRNVTDAVLRFTDRPSEISGTLRDGKDQPAEDYTVLLFPADEAYWAPLSRRIRATRAFPEGRFRFRDLPAGDYRLAAFVDVEPGAWQDPAFLEQLAPSSVRMSLGAGETRVQDLKVAGSADGGGLR